MSKSAPSRRPLRRLATAAVLCAVGFILSYIEAILPFSIGLPGVKLGLCHIVTVFALYRLSPWEAVGVTVTRVLLGALLFGNVASLAYSAAGAALSLAVMLLLVRFKKRAVASAGAHAFSPTAVSITGGVAHNIAQMAVAAALMQTAGILSYLPVLLAAGMVTGGIIGLVGGILVRRVPTI